MDPTMLLKKCILSLQSAKTDTEKFAALLSITKIVKAQDCDSESRNQMFEAIGFDFINRLLATKEVPEGCPPYIYQAIALTLLAYFCIDPQLVQHPQILSKVDDLTELVLQSAGSADDEKRMVSDSIQCLAAIAGNEAGKQVILQQDTIFKLCRAVKLKPNDDSLSLLMIFVAAIGKDCWQKHPESFNELMSKLGAEFAEDQSERKFEICQKMGLIMSSFPKSLGNSYDLKWPEDLHRGLSDILFSKIPVPHMEAPLKLAALMIDKFGVCWAMGETAKSRQFFLIFVHLVCIEVRMITEDVTFDQVLDDNALLTACFSALENVISFLVVNEAALDCDHKLQLYSAITNAMNGVITLLSNMAQTASLSVSDLDQRKKHMLFALVRVTAAWLAEETAALRNEVYEILPFLIKVANHSFEQNVSGSDDIDIMRFLLPGLCHLSAEDKARACLLGINFHKTLLDYLSHSWKTFVKHNKSVDYEMGIVTICGIFLNVVVLEGRGVANDSVYHELLHFILRALPELGTSSQRLALTGNLAVLGLLLLRHLAAKVKSCETLVYKYLSSSIKFLWDAHNIDDSQDYNSLVIALDYKRVWSQVMELWFLGMQALSTLLPKMPWISEFIVESGWANVIIDKLLRIQENAVEGSIKSAYEYLLCCLVQNGENVAIRLKDAGALDACSTHKLTELQVLLNTS